jgi:DNA-binding response OmpR family regulator
MTVLIYSDDRSVREQVVLAIGRRPAPELPAVTTLEAATEPAVISIVDKGGVDVIVLDGEAVPAGGLGICRTLKEEVYRCPPVLVLLGREQDAWLATWSRADATVTHPLDSLAVTEAVAGLLRARVARSAVRPSAG